MLDRLEVNNRQIRHTVGEPRRSSRLNFDATLAEAKAGLEIAEALAPVASQKAAHTPIHKFDDITDWDDGQKYPIYPVESLTSVKLRKTIARERGYVAMMAALALGVCTTVGIYDGTFTKIGNYVQTKFEEIGSYLDRPNHEMLQDFRQKAHRFHSQR
jgi:hypothetical protein